MVQATSMFIITHAYVTVTRDIFKNTCEFVASEQLIHENMLLNNRTSTAQCVLV